MNQVSIYRQKKSWILVKKILKKNDLEWNNWVQIIKMVKIQAANRNLPSDLALSNYLSLSACTVASRALSARASHTPALPNENAPRGLTGTELNVFKCFITSFIHIIFPLIFNMLLQWFNIFKVAFNRSIVNGLRRDLNPLL